MNIIQAAILGLVQGLAEFLPISSSGHLELAQTIMKLDASSNEMLLLTVLLHLGTLLAVLVVFWKDWLNILKNPFRSKTLGLLLLASLPALAVALVLDVDDLFGSGFLGLAFIITGVFLLIAEGFHKKKAEQVGVRHALSMGVMQAVALMPGVSRSGSTLLGGVASGLDRKSAAKFSFMMSAPAILGSFLLEGKKAVESGALEILSAAFVPVLAGVLIAAVSGFLAIRFMLQLINRISLRWFALYVFVLGALVVVLQVLGVTQLPSLSLPFLPK